MSNNDIQNVEEHIPESVSEENGERNISAQIRSQRQTVEYSSPIPLPKILKGYEEVDPTFPERIMAEFEKNSEHARNQEQKALDAQIQESKRGQYMVNTWRFFYQLHYFA